MNSLNLENFPPEILISQILPKMPLPQLLSLCQSNMYFNELCKDEQLWRTKIELDYPNNFTNTTKSFKQTYFDKSKYYDHMIEKEYPLALSQKPSSLLNIDFYHLLKCSYIYLLTIPERGHNKLIGFLYIIPKITTLSLLISHINTILHNNNIWARNYMILINDQIRITYLSSDVYLNTSLSELSEGLIDHDFTSIKIVFSFEFENLSFPLSPSLLNRVLISFCDNKSHQYVYKSHQRFLGLYLPY